MNLVRYDVAELLAILEPEADAAGDGGRAAAANDQHDGHALDATERARRYIDAMPEAVSGQGGHRALWAVALVAVRGFGLTVDEARPILQEYSGRCRPPWSDLEIGHKLTDADEKSRLPRGYLLNRRPNPSAGGTARRQGAAEPVFPLGPLTLRPGRPRRSPSGKVTVPVAVLRGSVVVDQVPLSNSASARRDARNLLALHLAQEPEAVKEIELVLTRVIAAAVEALGQKPPAAVVTIASVVASRVPEALGLTHSTDKGLWSEVRGLEIGRTDLCSFTPSWLLQEAAKAADVPVDDSGATTRPRLLKSVKAELEVLWADLQDRLPTTTGADLGKDTAAGQRFREAMVRLWTKTQTFEVAKATDEGGRDTVAARASLVSRVRTAARDYLGGKVGPGAREKWREVQKAFSSWWRPCLWSDGGFGVRLAMRWELVGQVGVELPGVKNQPTLKTVGERFGVIDASPNVSQALSGGAARLAVLSEALTRELLEDPTGFEDFDRSVTQ
jgi:hypothetical protein